MARLVQAVWQRLGWGRWLILWGIHPKFSIGISGYIVNEQGHVWLQKHRYWEDQSWGLLGGFMRAGESPEQALIREAREETGMDVTVGQLLDGEMFFRQGLTLCYAARFTGGSLQLDRREILAGSFFDVDDLPSPMTWQHRQLLGRVRKRMEVRHDED